MSIRARQKSTGTGDAGAGPGDYALGSPQSRAAARALLERRFAGRIARTIILSAESLSLIHILDVYKRQVVAAVQAYAKINAAGEWIDRTETVSLNDLFERMSTQELEAYAQSGALPGWFRATVGATAGNSGERESYGE